MTTLGSVLEMLRDEPLGRTRVVAEPMPPLGQGQVLMAVERFGMSSNNLTYALLGDMLGHWRPFPAAAGWGRVPPWGVATVAAGDLSVAPGGARFLGYLPMATHVLMHAVAAHPGIRDVSTERAAMLPMYRELRRVDIDPTWDENLVDAEVLMHSPAAALLDEDLRRAGAGHVVVSSASSKTSFGIGRLLVERGVRVTGLSSRARTEVAASVGAFDDVLPYDDVSAIPLRKDTAYVDVAGDPVIARAVHERLGPALSQSIGVGGSHLGHSAVCQRPVLRCPVPRSCGSAWASARLRSPKRWGGLRSTRSSREPEGRSCRGRTGGSACRSSTGSNPLGTPGCGSVTASWGLWRP